MEKIYFLFLMMVLISGCKTFQTHTPNQAYHSYDKYYTFEIITEPPDARIEINGNYIGDAPISYTVKCELNKYLYALGNFPMYDSVSLSISALPKQQDQYVQSKYLLIDPIKPETIPQKIFFDMYLHYVPPTQRYDINLE